MCSCPTGQWEVSFLKFIPGGVVGLRAGWSSRGGGRRRIRRAAPGSGDARCGCWGRRVAQERLLGRRRLHGGVGWAGVWESSGRGRGSAMSRGAGVGEGVDRPCASASVPKRNGRPAGASERAVLSAGSWLLGADVQVREALDWAGLHGWCWDRSL